MYAGEGCGGVAASVGVSRLRHGHGQGLDAKVSMTMVINYQSLKCRNNSLNTETLSE